MEFTDHATRLRYLMELAGCDFDQFTRAVWLTPQSPQYAMFREVYEARAEISTTLAGLIRDRWPGINGEWLLEGEGPVLTGCRE